MVKLSLKMVLMLGCWGWGWEGVRRGRQPAGGAGLREWGRRVEAISRFVEGGVVGWAGVGAGVGAGVMGVGGPTICRPGTPRGTTPDSRRGSSPLRRTVHRRRGRVRGRRR